MGKSKRDKVLQILRRQNELLCLPEEREAQTVDAIMQLFEKPKKQTEEAFAEFVEIWCEAYPLIGMTGGKVSGRMINGLIQDTRTAILSWNQEPTYERLVNGFRYAIKYVKDTHHFVDEKPLTTWKSQYLSIWTEIKSGKQIAKAMKSNNSSQVFGKYGN